MGWPAKAVGSRSQSWPIFLHNSTQGNWIRTSCTQPLPFSSSHMPRENHLPTQIQQTPKGIALSSSEDDSEEAISPRMVIMLVGKGRLSLPLQVQGGDVAGSTDGALQCAVPEQYPQLEGGTHRLPCPLRTHPQNQLSWQEGGHSASEPSPLPPRWVATASYTKASTQESLVPFKT